MVKNIELYNKTVDILFQAYYNDTLRHGDCYFCAVGNMVAAGCNFNFVSGMWDETIHAWDDVFMTFNDAMYQRIHENNYVGEAKRQIDSTGYHWKDLSKIEYAFETADKGDSEEDYMFNGLVAVLEVLKQIHEIDDDTDQVERFTAHHKVRVSA